MRVVQQRTARVGSIWLHHLYNVRGFLGYLPAYYKVGLDRFAIISLTGGNWKLLSACLCVSVCVHNKSVCVKNSVAFLCHLIACVFLFDKCTNCL